MRADRRGRCGGLGGSSTLWLSDLRVNPASDGLRWGCSLAPDRQENHGPPFAGVAWARRTGPAYRLGAWLGAKARLWQIS